MRKLPKMAAAGVCAAALSGVPPPCAAHHSFAMFDQLKSVTLQGRVRELRWTNPHVFIQLVAMSERGEEEWSIEMTSPEHLARVGWRPATLRPGDEVTIVIHPMHDGVKGGQFISGRGPLGALAGSSTAHQSAQGSPP